MVYPIRVARPDDADTLRDVNYRAWCQAYAHIYTQAEIDALFRREIVQSATWTRHRGLRLPTLTATRDDVPIGFVGAAVLADDETEGEITTLYVHPGYQGRGIGWQLWQAGLQSLRAEACQRAWVWVLARAEAVQFYERQGCVRTTTGQYIIGEHDERAIGFTIGL